MTALQKYLFPFAAIIAGFMLAACAHPGWYGGHHHNRGYYDDSYRDQRHPRTDERYRNYDSPGSPDQYQQPVTEKSEAEALVREMLLQSRNPNLKTGTVTDKGAFYEVEILSRNDSLVDIMQVDKETGLVRSAY